MQKTNYSSLKVPLLIDDFLLFFFDLAIPYLAAPKPTAAAMGAAATRAIPPSIEPPIAASPNV